MSTPSNKEQIDQITSHHDLKSQLGVTKDTKYPIATTIQPLEPDQLKASQNNTEQEQTPQKTSMSALDISRFQKKIIDAKLGIERMTPEQKGTYVKEYIRCEKIKHEALASRKVRYLFNSLAELGNVIFAPEKFVQCVHCDEPINAFALVTPENKSVVGICQNYIRDQTTTQNAISHELIHIYDQTRAYVDLNNCIHVACTEVRAAALSGECTKQREEERGVISPFAVEPGHFKQCVMRKAQNSVNFQPLCNEPEVCEKALSLAFDRCLADQAPFYAIPE